GRLDPLPLEQLRADALRDDPLEVRDALRLDPLALGFLLLLREDELHLLRFLLAPQLLLNGVRNDGWKPDLAQQDLLDADSPIAGHSPKQLEDLARDPLALRRIERLGFIRRRDLADRGSELRLDDRADVVGADGAVDLRRLRRIHP